MRADEAVKIVPTPDMSRLPPASAAELRNARADFEKSIPLLAGDALAENYAVIGQAYAQNGFYDAAAVAFEDAARLAPKDGQWVYAEGLIAQIQKRNAVAQNYFSLAFQLTPDYLPIRIAVAQGKINNHDLEGARKLIEDVVAHQTDQPVPYAMLAGIAQQQKRYAEAVTLFRHALALDPEATQLYAALADAEKGAGNVKAAEQARAKAGVVPPALVDPLGQRLVSHAATAATAAPAAPAAQTSDVTDAARALVLHDYNAARKSLDRALKHEPNDASVLALYARVEAAAGNLPAAKARAAAAVAADPKSALAHLSQGVALEMSGDDGGAQRAYEQAIGNDAKLAEAHKLLGALLLRNGHADAAVVPLRKLVQLDIGKEESWTLLVAADVVAGHCEAALRDVSDVLAKDANNKFLLRLFVRLASTCPAATADQKHGALEYGAKLYREQPGPVFGETYALALAANGKWREAIGTQQAAMFLLVRNRTEAAVPLYREFLRQFQAHKVPDRPWPADSAIFHPARLAPDPKAPPTTVAPRK